MPRKAQKRTPAAAEPYNTGNPGQSPAAPTGMAYGEHQASIQSQQQLPAAGPATSAPAAAAPGPDAMLEAAAAHSFEPVGLMAPSSRPGEPVTTGLPSGPGAGPEVLSSRPRAADTLEQLARATGDPLFAELAARARLRSR